jgi:hypothetical protein
MLLANQCILGFPPKKPLIFQQDTIEEVHTHMSQQTGIRSFLKDRMKREVRGEG